MDHDPRRQLLNDHPVATNGSTFGSGNYGGVFASNNSQVAMPDPLRPAQPVLTGAEKYEDDKRRIGVSCFSKKDEKGVLLQTYITHVRVEEDGAYPSSPPPPHANPVHKKQRAIIVAVKNSGRVWMHKARENTDGTFQIGKSWPMEELQIIESFSNPQLLPPEERSKAEWAGTTGFTITMQKPYFWKANSAREKDFFIQSLVKIYRKYTKGNVPQLIGFDEVQRAQVIGSMVPPPAQPASPQPSPSPLPSRVDDMSTLRPPPSVAVLSGDNRRPSTPSHERSGRSPSFASSDGQRPPSPLRHRNITASPQRSIPLSPDPSIATLAANNRGVVPQPWNLSQPSSREQLRPERLQSPATIGSPLTPQSTHSNLSERNLDRAYTGTSSNGQPRSISSPNQNGGSSLLGERWTVENSQTKIPPFQHPSPAGDLDQETSLMQLDSADGSTFTPSPQNLTPQPLPERRRPPLPEHTYTGTRSLRSVDEPKPLVPRVPRVEESTPPPRVNQPSPLPTAPGMIDSPVVTPPVKPEEPREATPPVAAKMESVLPTSSAPANGSNFARRKDTMESVDRDESEPEGLTLDTGPKFRPGLGPMTGRSDAAKNFQKIARAATAFKPRAGGAGAKLFAKQSEPKEEGEGITNVFKAPARTQTPVSDPIAAKTPQDKVTPSSTSEQMSAAQNGKPVVTVTPSATQKSLSEGPVLQVHENSDQYYTKAEQEQDDAAQSQRMAERKAKKRRSDMYARCFAALDIDPTVLRGREGDCEDILADFGWDQNILQARKMESIEHDLRHEISRLEAGAWLGHTDAKDTRLQGLERTLDKAIAECDEMEGLLTLYAVELSTLHDDISYIEAQSQGLQVQTANQKLLQSELQNLVNTVTIDAEHMKPLKRASIADAAGLEAVESCLVLLHKALNTIDPQAFRGRAIISANRFTPTTDFTNMRALQEKKDLYVSETLAFIERLKNYMSSSFGAAFIETQDAISRRSMSNKDGKGLDISNHDVARRVLWKYSPLMLFTRDVDLGAWNSLIQLYQERATPVYHSEFRDSLQDWQKTARKPTKEEQAAIFTAQDKEHESLTVTARKLTVKRSQTLARGFRSNSTSAKKIALDRTEENKFYPFEAFAGALEEMIPVIAAEQNFIIDFFHAYTQGEADFVESVLAVPAEQRRGTNLLARKQVEPDRKMAKTVGTAMEHVFASWPSEMQNLIDWAIGSSELNVVGVLYAVERSRQTVEDSNQEYMMGVLLNLQIRLAALFTKFIDDQIRAIEDTKVKTKKRKGVISFMRVFPNFSALVENMVPPADARETLETRAMVDEAYDRINRAMFDSLISIAKDSPVAAMGQASADPDDKEALNYHIMLIENMHHYLSEVEERGNQSLTKWRGSATIQLGEHQGLYVNAIIRRPLGKLLDFVEGTESLLASSVQQPSMIPLSHPSHSRSIFKKVMAAYTAKDLRKGIDVLRARVEKHFGEGDEAALSAKLMQTILQNCEKRYLDICERTKRIAVDVYERTVDVEFGASDIQAAFRK